MFTLKQLKIKNWCQHVEGTYNFTPGTNGLVGPNGVGKSNLLAAIFTGLTGKSIDPNDTLAENVNWNADTALIEIEAQVDSIPLTIQRKIKATRDDAGERPKITTTAKLQFGEEKVTGTNKVTKKIEELTGYTAKASLDHIFVSQSKLTELLFQQPSKRVDSFIGLIPVLAQAEPLRAAIKQELDETPKIITNVSYEEAKLRRKNIEDELSKLTAREETVVKQLNEIDIEQVKTVLTQNEKAPDINASITQLNTNIANVEGQLQTLIAEQAELDAQWAEALNKVKEQESVYKESQAKLAQLAQNKQLWATYTSTTQQIETIKTRLNALKEPQLDSNYDEEHLELLRQKYAEASAEITSLEKFVQFLSSGNKQCPTCTTEFADIETKLQESNDRLSKLKPPVITLQEGIQNLTNMKSTYDRELQTFTTSKENLTAQLAQLQNTLAQMPAVSDPSKEDEQSLTQQIKECESIQAEAKKSESKANDIKSKISTQNSSKSFYSAQLQSQLTAQSNLPSNEIVEQAKTQDEAHRQLQTEQATLRGEQNARNEALKQAKDDEERSKVAEEQGELIDKYHKVLNEARDILHRDQLPTEVMNAYLVKFEQYTNQFLALFGSPFIVEITKDMELHCVMPSGFKQRSARLSGGQQAVLSVSARFAIHELFSKQLGFLVMDEPSQNLDHDNVKWLSKLLEQVSSISKTTCAQTLIVTHHVSEMSNVFDNTITLAPSV